MPERKITLTQLTEAVRSMDKSTTNGPLNFGDYWTHDQFAAALYYAIPNTITASRPATSGGKTMRKTPDNPTATLTVAELDKALRNLGYTTALDADQIYERVVAYREPEWKTGDLVRSNANNVWARTDDGYWREMSRKDGAKVPDQDVNRPLTLIGRVI